MPNAVTLASYDAANELTNWNGTPISYDLKGNMLSDGTNAFSWNARDQVATLNGANLQYDAGGRRIKNATGTSFLYTGANAVQELSGSTVTANIWTGGTDEFFQRTDANGTVSPLRDSLGSVMALVNPSGSIMTQYTYDPFGNTTAAGAASTNPSQYTGRENEGNGLYYYRARYYSPVFGRFVNEDPTGFAGSGVNFYAYAGDNPISFNDPFGLSTRGDADAALASMRADMAPLDQFYANQKSLARRKDNGWEDIWNNPIMNWMSNNADYLPGACSGGVFAFGGVQPANEAGTTGGFVGAIQDYSYSPETGWELGKGDMLGEAFFTSHHVPFGGGTLRPSGELLAFASPREGGVPGGDVEAGAFAAVNFNHLGDGISIGIFGEGVADPRNVQGLPISGAAGGGAYLSFTNAAACLARY
jgi:RHS repeat-associated protein